MNANTFKDYYKLLGIKRESDLTQIRSAYKKLALQYHPDKNKNSEKAEKEFKNILEAYEILSDPNIKVDYDSWYDYETGSSTSKPEKDFWKSKGGLEAPVYTDYRGAANRAIWDALKYSRLGDFETFLGKRYFDAFGHQKCEHNERVSVWSHIYFCLDTRSEVDNFRNKILELFATYATELAKLKEEAITKIEKKLRNPKLSGDQRRKIKRESWKEQIQKESFTKKTVLYIGKIWEELIDDFVKWNEKWGFPSDNSDESKLKEILGESRKKIEDEKGQQKRERDKKNKDVPTFTHESDEKESGLRKEAFQKICEKLTDVEPVVHSSELDSGLWSPFSSWVDKIWKLEFDQLEDFQKQMLEAISQSRERERKERLKHIFDEAKNEAGSKLEEKIEQADENYGSQSYWDNEDLIKNLKAKSARENPSSYRQRVSNKIEEEMERSGVREEELANNIRAAKRKIVSGEIEEPSLIVESEMIVISSIRQAEANRNLNEIVNQARQALTSRSQKAIEKVKNQILEFISNPNVFCQNSYNNRRSEVQNYLNKLENYSGSEGPINSDNRFPLSVVLSIAAVLLLVIFLGFSFILQKNKKRY